MPVTCLRCRRPLPAAAPRPAELAVDLDDWAEAARGMLDEPGHDDLARAVLARVAGSECPACGQHYPMAAR